MTLDIDALLKATAQEVWGEEEPSDGHLDAVRLSLAVIVPAVTAEIRALHKRVPLHNLADECACPDPDEHEIGYDENGESICLTEDPLGWICAECYRDDGGLDDPVPYPCETVRLLDALDAAVRGGDHG